MSSKSSEITMKVAVIPESPIIAPHPAEPDIIRVFKPLIERHYITSDMSEKEKEKMLEKIQHIDRIFLRNSKGEPYVNGGFLKGFVNKYCNGNGMKAPDVKISTGKIEGKLVILPMRRQSELSNPEVLVNGRIVFEITGKPTDVKEFIRLAVEASKKQSIGSGGSRGFGKVNIMVIQE